MKNWKKRLAAILLAALLVLGCATTGMASSIAGGILTDHVHSGGEVTSVRWDGELEYIQHTADVHLKKGAARLTSKCSVELSDGGICGVEYEESVLLYESSEDHVWENGKCVLCGWDACGHSDRTEESVFTEEYDYDSCSVQTHWKYPLYAYVTTCNVCGKETRDEPTKNGAEAVEEDHSFVNSVCDKCSHVCEHLWTEAGEASPTGRYEISMIDTVDHYKHEVVEVDYNCIQCGELVYTAEEEGNGFWEAHDFRDGKCTVCAAKDSSVCTHENQEWQFEDYFFSGDCASITKYGHIALYDKVDVYECQDCWLMIEKVKEEGIERAEAHETTGGICVMCGWRSDCAHENVYCEYDVYGDSFSFGDLTETTHVILADEIVRVDICADCGEQVGLDGDISGPVTVPHTWWEGCCIYCGYQPECEHPNMTSEEEIRMDGWHWYDQITREKHTLHAEKGRRDACPDCGYEYWVHIEDVEKEEAHTIVNGVCSACSYIEGTCPHENARKTGEEWRDVKDEYVYYDDTYHTVEQSFRTYYQCDECGVFYYVDGEPQDVLYMHSFDEGECVKCGVRIECDHPENKRESWWVREIDGVAERTEKTHTLDGRFVKFEGCKICRVTLGKSEPQEKFTEEHSFDYEGICADCGYENTCDHVDKGIKTYYDERVSVVYEITDSTHTVFKAIWDYDLCAACDQVVEYRAGAEGEVVTEAHTYEAGYCTVCGHERDQIWTEMNVPGEITANAVNVRRQPTTDSAVADSLNAGTQVKVLYEVETRGEIWYYVELPDGGTGYIFGELITLGAPEAEPAYVEAEATAYGIAVTEDADIVKTVRMIAEAVAQKSETAEVTVCNIELLLTEEELAQLKELDLNEQLIVSLCAIGFEKQVDKAMAAEEEPLTLSDAAIALKTAVSERIAAMTEEEKAAFDALIAEHFPKNELISYDDRTFESFRLEVEITDGEEIVREAYEFRLEKTRWLLTKVLVKAE